MTGWHSSLYASRYTYKAHLLVDGRPACAASAVRRGYVHAFTKATFAPYRDGDRKCRVCVRARPG